MFNVIKESQLEKARALRDEISVKFLKGNKIKSSSKRLQNDEVRMNCLNHLFQNLDFLSYYLIVDKEKLNQSDGGLRFKEVFYKFFQKIFISRMTHAFLEFEIYMHQTISESYGEEMRKYLASKVKSTLFEDYHFLNDEKEPLIQLADLLAGSFGKCFNRDYFSENNEKILDILKSKFPSISFFPSETKWSKKSTYSDNEVNAEIFQVVRRDALNLMEKSDDEIFKIILEQLLMYQKIAPMVYLQTFELTNYAKYHFNKEISTEQLRLKIRDLRFEGIIIVSANNRSGYKLAVNQNDIFQYFNHYSKYILPMLKKIQIANDILQERTVGEYNPLKDFDELASMVNEMKIR